MNSFIATTSWLLQEASPRLGEGQDLNIGEIWAAGGFMMWPLGICMGIGALIIVWKFYDLQVKSSRTRGLLADVDELIAHGRLREALARCEDSKAPAAAILEAGLRRHEEGTAELEKGLVWLATLSNVAPLLGFLGTVIGMIQAFQAIEIAGEVEATLVAGGIKVALITTATGLAIAIPINIAHNYFVTRVDRLVIDMEESAQKMIDALHEQESARAAS